MFSIGLKESQSKVDWLLLLALGGLMLIGTAFIYSATMVNESAALTAWYNQAWFRQIVWYGLGLSAAAAICLVDYHIMARWSLVAYGLSIILLLAVFVVGSKVFGARRWIDLGAFKLQPSEFTKLSFIVAMAHYLSRPPDELRSTRVFLMALGMTMFPFVLIMKEPDLGSALILLPVGLTMLYVAGVPVRYLKNLMVACALLIALLVVDVLFAPPRWQIKMEDYQKRRLQVYFGRDFVPASAGPTERQEARRQQRNYSYNVEQALISVGSGGMLGKGWR